MKIRSIHLKAYLMIFERLSEVFIGDGCFLMTKKFQVDKDQLCNIVYAALKNHLSSDDKISSSEKPIYILLGDVGVIYHFHFCISSKEGEYEDVK